MAFKDQSDLLAQKGKREAVAAQEVTVIQGPGDSPVQMAHRGLQDLRDPQDLPANLVHRGRRWIPTSSARLYRGHKAPKELEVYRGTKDKREVKATPEATVRRVSRVSAGTRGRLVEKGRTANQG